MSEVIRVISDLHLGHVATRVKDARGLRPLVEDCEGVIFNGDIWQERWKACREEGAEQFDRLKELLADYGRNHAVLPGNHDPDTGLREGYVKLGSRGQILITHGNGIFPEASPFSREMWYQGKEIRKFIADHPEGDEDLEGRMKRARGIAKLLMPTPLPKLPVPLNFFATALWPPTRPFQIIRAWTQMGPAGFAFLDRFAPECTALICGHFHRAGIWEEGKRVMLNTGAFIRGSTPHVAEIEGDQIRLRKVKELRGVFYPCETVGAFNC